MWRVPSTGKHELVKSRLVLGCGRLIGQWSVGFIGIRDVPAAVSEKKLQVSQTTK